MTTITVPWQRPRPAGLHDATSARSFLNPRIRKEIRLAAPYFFAILVSQAMIVIGLFALPDRGTYAMLLLLFPVIAIVGATALPVACCALAVNSFCSEFQNQTLAHLLVQPVSRQRMWYEKFFITAAALLIPALLASGAFITVGLAARQPLALLVSFVMPVCALSLLLAGIGPSLALRFKRSLPALLAMFAYLLLNLTVIGYLGRGVFQGSSDDSLFTYALGASGLLLCVATAEYALAYRHFCRMEI